MLLRLLAKMSRVPKLLEVPELCAYHPGTQTPRVAPSTARKYKDPIWRFSEYLRSIGKNDNPYVIDITRADFAGFHDWLATRGTLAITTNGYRRRARAMWNILREDHRLPVCDITGITTDEPEPYQRDKAIAEDHLNRILQYASARDSAMILYMLEGGFRRQTVARLTLKNTKIWQGRDGRFRIASYIPQEKTSPPRLILAEHRTAIAVQNWLNIRQFPDSEWIFYNHFTGEQLTESSVNAVFLDLRTRCNIPAWSNVNPHALRHKFAQTQLDNHDARTVADWMGITVETLLNVYAARNLNGLISARYGDTDYPRDLLKIF